MIRKPAQNVLLLMADQLRFDALGVAGHPVVQTPHLDRLAADGVRFTQAVTPTPICMAARYSLLTGRRAGQTRVTANGTLSRSPQDPTPLPEPVWPTLMTCLGEAGYRTHGVGKFHFHRRPYGFHRQELMEECVDRLTDDDYLMHLQQAGFRTRYPQGHRDLLYYQPQTCALPEAHSQNRWVADRAEAFLHEHQRYRGDQPFFLWASWIAPHPPFAPVEPYDTWYDPADMAPPDFADRPLASLPAPAWAHRARLDNAHRDPERMARIKALYFGQVTHLDACVGRVLARLDQLGLADDTAVLFCSDHGEMLGDHGLSQKNTPYEPSLRIPLLLRWPGRTSPGKVCADPVGLTDVMPTLLETLDLPYPDGLPPLPGASLLGRAGGGLASPRQRFVIDFGHDDQRWVCLRSARKKYVYWACGGREEAYDLTRDPGERHNLALAEPRPPWVDRWRQSAVSWERTHGLGERSLHDGDFRVWPEPDTLPAEDAGMVTLNDGRWADRLPPDHPGQVESFAQAFDSAIAKETTLAPEKLSVASYLAQGGSLAGTRWQHAADDAADATL